MALRIASCNCGQLTAKVSGDPIFPAPTFSVYEDRMHAWVSMPEDMEHMGSGC